MANQNKTVLKTYFQTGDVPVEAEFVNLIDSLRLDPVTPTAHASTGTVTLTFDQDKIYPDVTQTGNITLAVTGSGNVRGVVQELTIVGDGVSILTFPANFSSGNAIIFNNTKINDIFIEYKTPTRILYNILLSAGTDTTPPLYNVQTITGISGTNATFNVQINEAGYVKWMVTTSATAPSKANILAGTGTVGSNYGSITMIANTTNTATATGLTAGTTYYLWSYAEDLVTNQTLVQSAISFTNSYNNTSLSLVGVNQIASTIINPTNLSFGNGGTDLPFSISGYAKYTSNGAEQRFVGFTGPSTSSDFSYNLGVYGNASNSMIFLIYDGTNTNRIGIIASSPVPLNTWFHYVATYDASKTNGGMKIYINGALQTTTSANSGTYNGMPASNSNMRVGIGGQPVSGAFSYANQTLLDELAIWNKTLSASEVTNIYNSGVPLNLTTSTPSANLKSWWRWENNMNDSGSNAYNLTGISSPTYSSDKP